MYYSDSGFGFLPRKSSELRDERTEVTRAAKLEKTVWRSAFVRQAYDDSRSDENSPDLVRSREISPDLARSCQILPDLVRSCRGLAKPPSSPSWPHQFLQPTVLWSLIDWLTR